jgi:hypothetical protein
MKQLSISTKLTNRDNDSLRQYFKKLIVILNLHHKKKQNVQVKRF